MKKFIFITGSGRCGTKLLHGLLDGNSKLNAIPGEITNFFKSSLKINSLSQNVHKKNYKELLNSFISQIKDSNIKGLNRIIKKINQKVDNKFLKSKTIKIEYFLELICDSFFLKKKPIVINLQNENIIGLLEAFPSCKVLHMIRNPLTQINSRYLFRYKSPNNYDGFEFGLSFYRNYNSFKNAQLMKKNRDVSIIKMEDLVLNTKSEIKKILNFLKFNFEKINLETTQLGKNIRTRNNSETNREKLSKDFSCLLPNDLYVISQIKYVKNFYSNKKYRYRANNFLLFYLRHLGFIGKNRNTIFNPWRFIKCSIFTIYLFILDINLKKKFLKTENI